MIDFHTHTFPNYIAGRALDKLSSSAQIPYYTSGISEDLIESMKKSSVDLSVVLPVATSPSQTMSINKTVYETNLTTRETGLLSFGAIHPDNQDYRETIRDLASRGVKGIKLHPVAQGVYFDDISYKRIISFASDYDMIIITHAGFDLSLPDLDYVTPKHILPIIEEVHPPKLVLAHMGGWRCWDDVEKYIIGSDVYLDTSSSIAPMIHFDHTFEHQIGHDQFLRMVRNHGIGRILMGSDSPWGSQADAIFAITNSGLTFEEQEQILQKNGQQLLTI